MAAVPAEEDLRIARFPAEPLVENPVTVCVVEAGRINPFVSAALLTAIVAKVFAPVTVRLSPENVMLLYVAPPPAKVLAVDDVLLTVIVLVFAFNVKLDVVRVQIEPVELTVHAPEPIVSVRVEPLFEVNVVQVTLKPLAFNVPFECVTVEELLNASCSVSVPPIIVSDSGLVHVCPVLVKV